MIFWAVVGCKSLSSKKSLVIDDVKKGIKQGEFIKLGIFFNKPDLHPEHFFNIKSSRSDNLHPGRLQTLKFSGIFLLSITTLSFEGMMKLGLKSPDWLNGLSNLKDSL